MAQCQWFQRAPVVYLPVQLQMNRSVVVANGVGSIRFNASGSSFGNETPSRFVIPKKLFRTVDATLFLVRFWC